MAVSTDFQKLRSALYVKPFDFDPDATSATDVGWIDARDYSSILFLFTRTVGTSATTMNILGNTAADGSGTDVTVKAVTISSEPNAFLDLKVAEVTAEEIATAGAAAGVALRGVSLSVAFATGTDEAIVHYVGLGERQFRNQTADIIA